MPQIHHPETEAQAAELVAWAAAGETPLAIVGAGTKAGFGHDVTSEHVVSTDRLSGIVDYEPSELVLTARPGTPMAEIEALIAQAGQMLAFEPPRFNALYGQNASPSLGGVIATNLSGPRRLVAGAARDHTLGLRCVQGRGEIVKAGGKVVKNVTGYDIPKVMAGSFGTLGVLTELTVKVLPRPETETTLVVSGAPRPELLGVLRHLSGTGVEGSGFAYLAAAASGRLIGATAPGGIGLVRLDGVRPSVDARIEMARGLVRAGLACDLLELERSRDLWDAVREVEPVLAGPSDHAVWRISSAPTAGEAVMAGLDRLGAVAFADWAGGLVWAAIPERMAGEVRALIASSGGHATLMRGSPKLKARLPVFEPQPAPLAALTKRVKASFDPLGILNPGRMG